jgi:hypothetical protein
MRQFIHSIPTEYIDAARIDGASEFHIFSGSSCLSSRPFQRWEYSFLTLRDDFWPFIILTTQTFIRCRSLLSFVSRNECRWFSCWDHVGSSACSYCLPHLHSAVSLKGHHDGYEGLRMIAKLSFLIPRDSLKTCSWRWLLY